MSPMEIWCNESQERYVLIIDKKHLQLFTYICYKERAKFSVIGKTTKTKKLIVTDKLFNNTVVDLPLKLLFDNIPTTEKKDESFVYKFKDYDLSNIDLKEAIYRVLSLPCVASKEFLITIGDRSVGGLVARDQMVGKWQVPTADCAIIANDFIHYNGQAQAMGEKATIAVTNPVASAKMAIGEALLNLLAVRTESFEYINLSANWMCSINKKGQGADLYKAVKAITMDLCPKLKIAIPVGKDSMFMQTTWQENNIKYQADAPLSLIISAFTKVKDIRHQLTPQISIDNESDLFLIDLSLGKKRLGGSALIQTFNQYPTQTPDFDNIELFKLFYKKFNTLHKEGKILAYHDISDGGAVVSLLEMAFSTGCGLDIFCNNLIDLFNEELGCIIQIDKKVTNDVIKKLQKINSSNSWIKKIATPNYEDSITFFNEKKQVDFSLPRSELQQKWGQTSYEIAKIRQNSECVDNCFEKIRTNQLPLLRLKLNQFLEKRLSDFKTNRQIKNNKKFKVAILREQGINGHIEMAAAFNEVGFCAVDVHMSDLIDKKITLDEFSGLVACGGFSYGDVLGAGRGWANSILFNSYLKKQFKKFFERNNTFTLGVCNGCQMLSFLKKIIPGSNHFPKFLANTSNQFESRLLNVCIKESKSIFFKDMANSIVPIVVAHGEGKACFDKKVSKENVIKHLTLQYIDINNEATTSYPENPNGSEYGTSGITNEDGRVTLIMPHPERVFRKIQFSYYPNTNNIKNKTGYSPWIVMFENARKWLEKLD